jgi:hypothetical protein
MTTGSVTNVDLLRNQVAQQNREIGRHIKNADDVTETLNRLEDRFAETIGLLKALEAIAEANSTGTIASVAKAIRGDYTAMKREFVKLETRCSSRNATSYAERDKAQPRLSLP